jgi:hypothetical protein
MPLDGGSHWTSVRLGEVTTSFAGGTPSRSKSEYFGPGVPWLKSGEVRAGRIESTSESITELGLRKSSARIAKAGTPVIAMYGATAGVAGRGPSSDDCYTNLLHNPDHDLGSGSCKPSGKQPGA